MTQSLGGGPRSPSTPAATAGIRPVLRIGAWLSGVLLMLCVTLFADVPAGHSERARSPIGIQGIKRVLTGHKRWTLYWEKDHLARPRFGSTTSTRSPSLTLEFWLVGPRLIGHVENDEILHMECEFDVMVREDGFTFAGCWGPDKPMTYDPDDLEYPFKGRADSMLLWLAPSR